MTQASVQICPRSSQNELQGAYTSKGDKVVAKLSDDALRVKYGLLTTITGVVEEISYTEYERLKEAMMSDARFVELRDGDFIAVNQIARLKTAEKNIVSKAEQKRRIEQPYNLAKYEEIDFTAMRKKAGIR